jgi:hypothetical protein
MDRDMSNETTLIAVEVNIKTSDGAVTTGTIHLNAEQRISDIFTESAEPFLILLDATSTTPSGQTLVINKKHVVWIEPKG